MQKAMQEALDHFDKSLSGVENLPSILSYPPLRPSPHPSNMKKLRPAPYLSPRSTALPSQYSSLQSGPPSRNYSPSLSQQQSTPGPPSRNYSPSLSQQQSTPGPPSRNYSPSLSQQQSTPGPPSRNYSPSLSQQQSTPGPPSRNYSPSLSQQQSTPLPPSINRSPLLSQQSTSVPPCPLSPSKPLTKRGKESRKAGKEAFCAAQFSPLSEYQIRAALLKWVCTRPSYRKKAARETSFHAVTSVVVFIYRLESFIESRSVNSKFEPYGTHAFDYPIKGRTLDPWDISVSPYEMFKNEIKCVRIPHTDEAQLCPECEGKRCVPCKVCFNTGTTRCTRCHGTGKTWFRRICTVCQGRQLLICATCLGTAQLSCPSCIGQGFCCYFKELQVEYRNIMYQHTFTTLEIPHHLLAEAKGEILYEEDGRRVSPISSFPEEGINKASQVFVEISERVSGPNCQILWQRHCLKAVPVTSVCYHWKKDRKFFVYGIKNSVYCIDYPSRSTSCLPSCLVSP
ncbi:protein SSUH2 homolog [Microcaecilia unicolor]|uniref:Protein SSUH2 homolog n=1 Tax=Microcaecilia unicolor TaxID=1415580 RepID=A0A6P7Z0S0_9AMPH|nr:protein SSUH2 homolog [Microcaecilia unicolor]